MPKYITVDDLAAIIKSDKEPMKDYLVVDVRDDDYRGGNIKDSLNLPSTTFLDGVDGLVEETKAIPLVIFHCALSQQRGPQAALKYTQARFKLQEGDDADIVAYEVVILRGGFTEFQDKYKDDPELVEKWDKRIWGLDPYDEWQ